MGQAGFTNETPHRVKLTRPYYMGKYEVTSAEWQSVMSGGRGGGNTPVSGIDWNQSQAFMKKLNTQMGLKEDNVGFSLPTAAQWEYACRAGTTTAYCLGDNIATLRAYAWFQDNSGGRTHPVGTRKPNDWGIYDMHGNLYEWMLDFHVPFTGEPQTDPTGPPVGS
jgi:formylglycine-generating enzyme required for sulfatase activity